MWLAQMWPDPERDPRPEKLQSVHEAYRLIRLQYLGEVTDRDLQQGAIEGMVGVLDGVSSYVPPGQMETFSDHMRGVIHGYGLKLEPTAEGSWWWRPCSVLRPRMPASCPEIVSSPSTTKALRT